MAQYIVRGNGVSVVPDGSMDIRQNLPLGTYFVKTHMTPSGIDYYLERTNNMMIPQKLFGDIQQKTQMIVNTFINRKNRSLNTGVLLSGERGAGKTLQAKVISNELISHNIPTIIVNDKFNTTHLSMFLKDIAEPTFILFEEFDKFYGGSEKDDDGRPYDVLEAQDGLLTLLDGVVNSNKLFVFTCNRIEFINAALINRPGRIWYHLKYSGLDCSTINEYCQDHLKNQAYLKDINIVADLLGDQFTFDILQALVEETNRQNTDPLRIVPYMNIERDYSAQSYVLTDVSHPNPDIKPLACSRNAYYIDNYTEPHSFNVYFNIHFDDKANELIQDMDEIDSILRNGRIECDATINQDDLKQIIQNSLIYEKCGFRFTFTKYKIRDPWKKYLSL